MQISSLDATIIVSEPLHESIKKVFNTKTVISSVFILVDENTKKHCLPQIIDFPELDTAKIIEVRSGESNKNLETTRKIWDFLTLSYADRHSLLIILGGGVLGDMGGFAASTFKRGIDFITIPTTLLAQVDASIGGKLGINSLGYKNEIGIFRSPEFVIINSIFLQTLTPELLLSGYAEMVKHALIYSSEHWTKIKTYDILKFDHKSIDKLISKSIFIKNDFVKNDPKEKDIRKALNFGHTVGHAIESYLNANEMPIDHGRAVAHGIIIESFLSHLKLRVHLDKVNEIAEFLISQYGKLKLSEADLPHLFKYMQHDKKNVDKISRFSLLPAIGEVEIDQVCTTEEVVSAFEFYFQL